MITTPNPLPLLCPWIDLRGRTSVGGLRVQTPMLYPSIIHASGIRRPASSAAGLFSAGDFLPMADASVAYVSRPATSLQMGAGYLTQTADASARTPSKLGDSYVLYYLAPQWGEQGTLRTQTGKVGGTQYSVATYALENLLAFSHYSHYPQAVSVFASDSAWQYRPWGKSFTAGFGLASPTTYSGEMWEVMGLYAIPGQASSSKYHPVWFAPSRPMVKPPELLETCQVDQLVSIGGKSYRRSYARRRIYEVTLLLDGSWDMTPDGGADPTLLWAHFLRMADAGVTLFVDRTWLTQFWRPRTAVVCPNMPNMISGQLLDATSLRFAGRNGLPSGYEVTLQITDETGCEGILTGRM